jgi:arginyl-tRNA--protein-N-Asp/Glu arginylyltransferase
MSYLSWKEHTVTDFSPREIERLYDAGFVFTRRAKGDMQETRSSRIDLSKFDLSSENRRILKKTEEMKLSIGTLPYADYHWEIGKLAKDFYGSRRAEFSANKIKELMTAEAKSNFNRLYVANDQAHKENGYCIAFMTDRIVHYCYPFYSSRSKDFGLGMMLRAIIASKESGKQYFYIGSLQRPSDTYKLQFAGLEWWNGNVWSADLGEAKNILARNDSVFATEHEK